MSEQRNRRDFLKSAAVGGFTVWVGARAEAARRQSPNDRVNFACIGVGGKGESDSNDAARLGNVVAICDVDDNTLSRAAKKWPDAKTFNDYRKMYEQMGKSIDAVTVSTPDHSHGPATAIALHMGKGCFTQKPLAHSVYEVRKLAELARRNKCATQMGNQGTADSTLRKNAYAIRGGALGKVTEVHVWTNRPIWPQGLERPAPEIPPSNLHWDLWLGPAKERPYGKGYHTFAWRGWWDFGTGALGDMACHTVNLPYMALDLRDPSSIQATSSGHNRDSYPNATSIHFEFPATKTRGAVSMVWYDGGKLPPRDLFTGGKFKDLLPETGLPTSGSLIIGDKGRLYSPGDSGAGGHFVDIEDIGEVQYPKSPGHFEEYVRAIKGGEPAMSNFPDYAGGLAETILLGNLAVWPANLKDTEGIKIEWDAKRLKAKNAPEVEPIIRPDYRGGYSL